MNASSHIDLRNGNKIPVLALGTWELTGTRCVQAVGMALEMGYRMIDTSSDYGNQSQVGVAINNSRIPREDIFLVTKIEEDDNAYEATKEYLEELGQEYADLVVIHRPPAHGDGEELWQGLIRVKEEGLTRNIGVSNYSIEQIERLVAATGVVPVVNQIEWSPFGHSIDMLDYCREHNIIIQAYSPLTRQERLDEDTLHDLADKYEKTPAQIIIRWNLQHKVVPIIKASTKEHLEQNLQVFDFSITSDDMSLLDSLNEQYSALGRRLQYA